MSDKIDHKKALWRAESKPQYSGRRLHDAYEEMSKAYLDLSEKLNAHKWVAVEDGLPCDHDEKEVALVLSRKGRSITKNAHSYFNGGKWVDGNAKDMEGVSGGIKVKVIAWKHQTPLPVVPK